MVVGDRISMDGVLHRIPYGRSLSMSSQNIYAKAKVGAGSAYAAGKKDASHRRFTKSRSLSESLERYSSLLESAAPAAKLSSSPEQLLSSKRPMKSLSSKSLTRIRSMMEFDFQHLTDLASPPLISRIASFQRRIPSVPSTSDEDDEKRRNSAWRNLPSSSLKKKKRKKKRNF